MQTYIYYKLILRITLDTIGAFNIRAIHNNGATNNEYLYIYLKILRWSAVFLAAAQKEYF
jgi:hypothetical protein